MGWGYGLSGRVYEFLGSVAVVEGDFWAGFLKMLVIFLICSEV
jgi:hypothetical protein